MDRVVNQTVTMIMIVMDGTPNSDSGQTKTHFKANGLSVIWKINLKGKSDVLCIFTEYLDLDMTSIIISYVNTRTHM